MNNHKITVGTAIHKADREYQQDRVEAVQHPYNKQCLMIVLADGMGGRTGGAKASEQVVQSAHEVLSRFEVGKDDPDAMMRELVMDASAVIRTIKFSSEQEPHTTVAAHLLLPSGACHWIHCGDSRIYHFRKGQFIKRTRDHSFIQDLIDKGDVTEEQALTHPRRNLLSACLGMAGDLPVQQHTIEQLVVGDVILSCSDGLWAYFDEEELAKIVDAMPVAQACEHLVDQARKRAKTGRGDNISVAILKVNPA